MNMKKRLFSVLIMVMISVTLFAQGKCLGTITDSDGYVNVRKSMSTNSAIVQRIKEFDFVYITPTGSNWYRVSLSPKGGYIGYIYYDRVEIWTGGYNNKYATNWDFVVTDADGYTNVRQLATTKSNVVKRLKRGKHFLGKYAADADGWIGVFEDDRLIGFVHQSKVKRNHTITP